MTINLEDGCALLGVHLGYRVLVFWREQTLAATRMIAAASTPLPKLLAPDVPGSTSPGRSEVL
jgi:hypothetical protein